MRIHPDHQHHPSPPPHDRRRPPVDGLRFRLEGPDPDATAGPLGRGRGPHHGPGHGSGRGPGHGVGGGFGGGFGGGPGGGPGGGFGGRGGRRGPRARGDVRAAVLLLLDEQPRHGYELIQEIAERSSGVWTPSPGSVYPTLQALEDEGLVEIQRVEGRRVASLTAPGAAYVEENRASLGEPWTTPEHDHTAALDLRRQIRALMDAVGQVAKVGTPAQHAAAAAVLTTARRDLYRVLADDPSAPE